MLQYDLVLIGCDTTTLPISTGAKLLVQSKDSLGTDYILSYCSFLLQ